MLTLTPTVQQVTAALTGKWWTHRGTARTLHADALAILRGDTRSPHGHTLPTLAALGLAATQDA